MGFSTKYIVIVVVIFSTTSAQFCLPRLAGPAELCRQWIRKIPQGTVSPKAYQISGRRNCREDRQEGESSESRWREGTMGRQKADLQELRSPFPTGSGRSSQGKGGGGESKFPRPLRGELSNVRAIARIRVVANGRGVLPSSTPRLRFSECYSYSIVLENIGIEN